MLYGVSSAKSCPFVMIQILSASSSASSRCWELMIIDLPAFKRLISSQTYLLDSMSSPDVGSSKIKTFGLVTIAIANESFLFMPPDISFPSLCLCSVSITTSRVSLMVLSISYGSMALSSHTSLKCSSAFNASKRTSNCWQRPRFF